MNNVVTSILATFAWLVAPAGLVVSTLLLWQNVQKLREAHLKIGELEHNARERDRRVSPATIEEQRKAQLEFDGLMRDQQKQLRADPRRAVATSLLLMLLASIPLFVLVDRFSNQSRQLAAATAAREELTARLRHNEEALDHSREAVRGLERALRDFVDMHEGVFLTPDDDARREAIKRELDAARQELLRPERP
jgi:hypothetical protein